MKMRTSARSHRMWEQIWRSTATTKGSFAMSASRYKTEKRNRQRREQCRLRPALPPSVRASKERVHKLRM
jgi:hypothetical protein